MTGEFVREERYIVFKLSDLGNSLKGDEIRRLAREYAEQRRLRKKPLECVVVEKDWPEYEPTWKAIEARVTGAQPSPSVPEGSAVQTAARIMNADLIRQRDDLRAKIAEMEQQEPVAKVRVHQTGGNAGIAWSVAPLNDFDALPLMRDGSKLYALPGAQAQPATKAVAYLDLGVGGYMDVGTDLTDEELAALPKGRHMLGIIGTYGVDGYVPAQNAPSVPHGWKLVPIEPTEEMLRAMTDPFIAINGDNRKAFESAYKAMLAAAPETKP